MNIPDHIIIKYGITPDIPANSLLVTDENIYPIIKGNQEFADKLIFPINLKADIEISQHIASYNQPIFAVGSGTINDLCKYASAISGQKYRILASAPSMNGYASANTSLYVDGKKQSLKGEMAEYIYMDLGILSSAPKYLIKSGVGDILCRSTAQADWLLSHHMKGTYYDPEPFEWVKEDEKQLFVNLQRLIDGDQRQMHHLARILILSGLGMTKCGGSYPASQGEHMIAHSLEDISPEWAKLTHGEQIAITTITMAEIQESLVNSLDFHQEIKKVMVPSAILKARMEEIGINYHPHISMDIYNNTVKEAYKTRDRFTFLNLK